MNWIWIVLGVTAVIALFGAVVWAFNGDEPDHTDPWDDEL